MRILLLSRYSRLGASSRVRAYQYLPYLEACGFKVKVAPLLNDVYLRSLYERKRKPLLPVIKAYVARLWHLLRSRKYDLLWIEKELFPWLPAWVEQLLARMGIPYIVDYDDAVFHNYDLHHNHLVRAFLGSKIDEVMRHAALVIVGNEYLAERAKKAGARRVEILPSVIDLHRYTRRGKPKNQVFTVGWIGSPVTAKYLKHVHNALAEVCQNGKGKLVAVGAGQMTLDGVPMEIRPWREENEVSEIESFDVGIMSLPDAPWERGKCGYKLIQYMACGKPVVASPVGVNAQIVEHGINGFLASTDAEWVRALSLLRDDPELRRQMGEAGRQKVEKAYCIQVTGPRLAELLRSVSR